MSQGKDVGCLEQEGQPRARSKLGRSQGHGCISREIPVC